MKDFKTIQRELAQPFAPEDLEWRVQVTNKEKTKGTAMPFVLSLFVTCTRQSKSSGENG